MCLVLLENGNDKRKKKTNKGFENLKLLASVCSAF